MTVFRNTVRDLRTYTGGANRTIVAGAVFVSFKNTHASISATITIDGIIYILAFGEGITFQKVNDSYGAFTYNANNGQLEVLAIF